MVFRIPSMLLAGDRRLPGLPVHGGAAAAAVSFSRFFHRGSAAA